MKKIIILGAGLTGLSSAYHLQKLGMDFTIYEKENSAGGLCRSLKLDGFTLDYAEHFLRISNIRFKRFIFDLMKDNISSKAISASIYFKNRHIGYPFQKNLFDLPKYIKEECLKDFLEAASKKRPYSNFAEWIDATFGKSIAKYFMIPYNRKIWTYEPTNMSASWFKGEFMPKHDLESVKESAKFSLEKRKENNVQIRWYPKNGGTQAFTDAFITTLKDNALYYNKKAQFIDLKGRKIIFADGNKVEFDIIITTIPLNELIAIIKGIDYSMKAVASRLRHNSVFCLNYAVDRNNVTTKQWIYFPENKFRFSRLYFLKNFSENSVPDGKSIITALITYSDRKPLDRKNITKTALNEIIATGIINKTDKVDLLATQDIKYGFAIPTLDLSHNRDKIHKFLRMNGIYSIGRYGNWEYSGMEHAIEAGEKIAKEVCNI